MPYAFDPGDFDAIGCVELTSIARGYESGDAMLKRAPVSLVDARPISPGKFIVIVTGPVAAVEESVAQGRLTAASSLTGSFVIPNLSPQVLSAINRRVHEDIPEAAGVCETYSAASAVMAADAAVKAAAVTLQTVWLANGLGGKAFFVLSGTVSDVQAAVEAGMGAAPARDRAASVVIPRVHGDLIPFLSGEA